MHRVRSKWMQVIHGIKQLYLDIAVFTEMEREESDVEIVVTSIEQRQSYRYYSNNKNVAYIKIMVKRLSIFGIDVQIMTSVR